MNQANQKQVMQEANMNLVQIRQFELDYFSGFFSNFGTQSALMIGFIAGSLSQVPGIENPVGTNYFFVVLYWVTSALTMATGMHALVSSVFLQVFGQGLALRGPVGSMVRAVEGMIAEQEQIFYSFLLTITFFGLQAIGMYWVMMDQSSAIACSLVTVVAMAYWYTYSLRVYNRFSWAKHRVDWQEEEDPNDALDDLNPSALQNNRNGSFSNNAGNAKSVKFATDSERDKDAKGDKKKKKSEKSSLGDELQDIDRFVAEKTQLRGGYLTIKGTGVFGRDPWERKFFVVRDTLIYYYKDKRCFELEPQHPINRRPIDLEGYSLIAGAVEPPYMVALVPIDPDDIRKAWKFRCDTLSEFNNWVEVLTEALRHCESTQAQGDLIKVSDGKSEVLSRVGDLRQQFD